MKPKTRSNIDTIKKALSKKTGLNEDITLRLIKHFFRETKKELMNPTKPEITLGYVGRFRLKRNKVKSYIGGLKRRIDILENGWQGVKEKHLGVEGLRQKRLEKKLETFEPLLEILNRIYNEGKNITSNKRSKH